jgi:hypothetical protein
MIKSLFVFFSYLAFLLLGIFNADTVLIENNTPAMIATGVRSMVEVNIRKGDVQGFSKLELTLPDGFIATPGDIKGASFTFSGDKAKFVWMNLPEESVFKVTYYIESEPGVEGAYEIKGTFSYVRENIREDIYVPTRTVIVKQNMEIPAAAEATSTAPAVRVEQPFLEMTCERRIERLGDNEYLVRLKVNNNRIVGFGKILEILPDNCSTNRDNDGGAVITQDANSIKFVWFEVPTAPSFEISYRVMCISDGTVPSIRGQLSYTENGNPFTVDVVQTGAPEDLLVNQNTANTSNTNSNDAGSQNEVNSDTQDSTSQVTQNSNTENTSNETSNTTTSSTGNSAETNNEDSNISQNESTKQDSASSEYESNIVQNEEKEQNSSSSNVDRVNVERPIKSMPSAENGITYKVQILAAHRVVDKSFLMKTYSFDEDYNIENHNGWIKYTTGKYTQYKDARDARVRITNASSKLPGPFVTAYSDGERITVQEALLVSKQLWYK